MRVNSTLSSHPLVQTDMWAVAPKLKGRQPYPCVRCGTVVMRWPCVAAQRRVFCTLECLGEFHREEKRRGQEHPCEKCGKLVWRKPHALKKSGRVFCSRECTIVQVTRQCAHCGADVTRPQSQFAFENVFCSRTCSALAQTPRRTEQRVEKLAQRVDVACFMCGAIKQVVPSRVKDRERHFCTRSCVGAWRRQYQSGEDSPIWKGGRPANNARKEADPRYRLKKRIANRIWWSLKGKKNYRHWEDLVGYTLQDLMARLEPLFQDGMTWENYGQWHIDHIRPVSSFSFDTSDEPEFLECWALSNLQPLWKADNLKKGDRWLDSRLAHL